MSDAIHGACLCGSIRFEIEPPTMGSAHCHCSMCRRAHGAAYVTWVRARRAGFRFIEGEKRLVTYRSSERGRRSFCRTCGSTLFCELVDEPDTIDVARANLEGPVDEAPRLHIFWDDRVDWAPHEDDLPRLGGVEGTRPVED